MRSCTRSIVAGLILATLCSYAAAAEQCPTNDQPINTDRPDVTNSSVVVPVGSFQSENGSDFSTQRGDQVLDVNSRLRLGISPCLEILLDMPSYVSARGGETPSGFANVMPAVKWQISPQPGQFDLSATFGVGLPTGATAITGPGVQPYLQFPWSKTLTNGWSLSAMLTFFTRPADPVSRFTTETTFVVVKELDENFEIFTEYVGDFAEQGGGSRQLINSGALWRFTRTQQLCLHFAFGLNNNSPDFIVGLGYSFRIDNLFR
jgi:hypothetical protein